MVPRQADEVLDSSENGEVCRHHDKINEILSNMRSNSTLKWKVMAGTVTLVLALFGTSMHFSDRSADRVISELKDVKKELVQNQDTLRAQMFVNTQAIGGLVSAVNRLETGRSKP